MTAYEKIPDELKQVPRWVCWVDDKTPINPARLCGANSTDPQTWGTFEQAAGTIGKTATYAGKTAEVCGVGFVLGDGWAGVDMDSHDGPLDSALVDEFMAALPTYTEFSRSGDGLHMIGRCAKTFTGSRKKGFPVEMYTGGRYFIMTGNLAADFSAVNDITEGFDRLHAKYIARPKETPTQRQPSEISMDDRDVIERAERSKTGAEFQALMVGDTSAYGGDHSAADQAICNRLAFWTGCDADQMDRIFRTSGLMRDKWDRMTGGQTYGARTISKAIEDCGDVYNPEHGRTTAAKDFAEVTQGDVFGRSESTQARKGPEPLKVYSAAELDKMDLHPPDFIVKNFMPVGVGILAAPSKLGKSWWGLDLGLSVAEGKPFLGFETVKGDVLYLALEDSLFRLKDRVGKILRDEKKPPGLTMTTESENMTNGFIGQLDAYLTANAKTRLVMVDTFQKIKPPTDKGKTAYEQDYETLGRLKQLSDKHNVCILLVHHTRKTNGFVTDPFEGILGSTALQGATDFMYVIQKEKRTGDTATLTAAGRDIPPYELCIRFDKALYRWINDGDAENIEQIRMETEYRNNPIVRTIIAKLEEIEADPNEPVKEYVARPKDIRQDTMDHTGELIGSNEKAFSTELKKWLLFLQVKDRIKCIEPEAKTTYKGKKGSFYRFKRWSE